MRFKKVDWTLRDKALIKNMIEVLRYYNKRINNVDNKYYCWNHKRRFQIQEYVEQLQKDLKLQLSYYKFIRRVKE